MYARMHAPIAALIAAPMYGPLLLPCTAIYRGQENRGEKVVGAVMALACVAARAYGL